MNIPKKFRNTNKTDLNKARAIFCPFMYCRIKLYGQPELDAHISLIHESRHGEDREIVEGKNTMNEVNESIVFYAFRYALGRKTYAVYEVYTFIREHWNFISDITRRKIQAEIKDAIELDRAGMEMDQRLWEIILNL